MLHWEIKLSTHRITKTNLDWPDLNTMFHQILFHCDTAFTSLRPRPISLCGKVSLSLRGKGHTNHPEEVKRRWTL